MLTKLILEQVINSQADRLALLDTGMKRETGKITALQKHAVIITGIRRCGKSTLMQQINKNFTGNTLFINFEDPRLSGFNAGDFDRLHQIIINKAIKACFFDEIQNVEKWENYVRFALDEGLRLFISGSNATMLSRELGTKLTGRYIPYELFPFSFAEYLDFTGNKASADSTGQYLKNGGFPEMLKTNFPEILMSTFNDIVIRDIAVRHGIRNVSTLQQLAVWLISNVAKPVTGNSLKKIFDIGSSSSIMEYLLFFSDAYLFFFVPLFSYSQKVQIVNAKKVYSIDTGLITVNSTSFSNDKGRLLENLVFLHMRRKNRNIYYYKGRNECDFVIYENGRLKELIQTCLQVDSENLARELAGLKEAMDFFKKNTGTIITFNQADKLTEGKKTITLVPFYEWAK
jgi:uncharacterized protein